MGESNPLDFLKYAAAKGDSISYKQSGAGGMDWDPQQYQTQSVLMNKLDPESAKKMLALTLAAKGNSRDPSMNGGLRESFMQQAAALNGGTSLGEQQAISQAGGGTGGSMGSGWSSNNSANAGLAQNLMRDQTAAADAHQKQALAAGKTNTDMVDSYGGVKESKKDRRDFLLQVLGLVR